MASTAGPTDTVTVQGNDAEFHCNSNNSATVTWLHDNGANEPFMAELSKVNFDISMP